MYIQSNQIIVPLYNNFSMAVFFIVSYSGKATQIAPKEPKFISISYTFCSDGTVVCSDNFLFPCFTIFSSTFENYGMERCEMNVE